jgi:hypothetical protein
MRTHSRSNGYPHYGDAALTDAELDELMQRTLEPSTEERISKALDEIKAELRTLR